MAKIEPFEAHRERHEAWFVRHDAACISDSPRTMLAQARRVLRPGAVLVMGFIDRDSALGRYYESHREESVNYRDATFYSASEVERLVIDAGFSVLSWAQTLSRSLEETVHVEPVRLGRGQGAFVVVHARNDKPSR